MLRGVLFIYCTVTIVYHGCNATKQHQRSKLSSEDKPSTIGHAYDIPLDESPQPTHHKIDDVQENNSNKHFSQFDEFMYNVHHHRIPGNADTSATSEDKVVEYSKRFDAEADENTPKDFLDFLSAQFKRFDTKSKREDPAFEEFLTALSKKSYGPKMDNLIGSYIKKRYSKNYEDFLTKGNKRSKDFEDFFTTGSKRSNDFEDFLTSGNKRSKDFQDFLTSGNKRSRDFEQFFTSGNKRSKDFQDFVTSGNKNSLDFNNYNTLNNKRSKNFEDFFTSGNKRSTNGEDLKIVGNKRSKDFEDFFTSGNKRSKDFEDFFTSGNKRSKDFEDFFTSGNKRSKNNIALNSAGKINSHSTLFNNKYNSKRTSIEKDVREFMDNDGIAVDDHETIKPTEKVSKSLQRRRRSLKDIWFSPVIPKSRFKKFMYRTPGIYQRSLMKRPTFEEFLVGGV